MDRDAVLLVGLAAIVVVVSIYSISSTLHLMDMQQPKQQQYMGQRMAQMSLTNFDTDMARQNMDKNGDGMCDICGMPVTMCIDSGQIECNVDMNAKIGVLGSQHIHADWKIYINGKALDDSFFESLAMDMSKIDSKITSSFIHMDRGAPAPERTGDVIHMHATGVPFRIFFNSVGMELLAGMKAYANGKEIGDWQDYVFKDNDKILITDGVGNLDEQLASVTNFAAKH